MTKIDWYPVSTLTLLSDTHSAHGSYVVISPKTQWWQLTWLWCAWSLTDAHTNNRPRQSHTYIYVAGFTHLGSVINIHSKFKLHLRALVTAPCHCNPCFMDVWDIWRGKTIYLFDNCQHTFYLVRWNKRYEQRLGMGVGALWSVPQSSRQANDLSIWSEHHWSEGRDMSESSVRGGRGHAEWLINKLFSELEFPDGTIGEDLCE